MKRILLLALLSAIFLFAIYSTQLTGKVETDGLTMLESQVMALINGTRAYNDDLELEGITLNHEVSSYAFRAAGSTGANATADWIAEQIESFGLEADKEPFQFTNWDLPSQPMLIIDDDGDSTTTDDQITIRSFQSTHYSWPTPQEGVFADLVILPLPTAANRDEIGASLIDVAAWDAVDTTDRVLLIGREVRWDGTWQETFKNKLTAQTPVAVIYTWWHEWMSFVPDFFSSAGGRPTTPWGAYYWDLEIPVGFVNYEDGLWIRNRETSVDISAGVTIESVVGFGAHYNVVGRLSGYEEPEKVVILSSHYDTVMCSGFCDNGAGTAGVLELARVFSEAVETGLFYPKYTILFITFASEEIGLVGSINYVMRHKAEMNNIVAVINLDCIGSDTLEVSETDPDNGMDLDQIVLDASGDLGVSVNLIPPGNSDEWPFLDPLGGGDNILMWWWGMSLDIGDAHPVGSSCSLLSYPYLYRHVPSGWIHTSYDNSTSTETLNWVEVDDLEDHIKVAALTVMRVSPPVLQTDLNDDGKVSIVDVAIVAKAFGSHPNHLEWNPNADLDGNKVIDIIDVSKVAKDFGKEY